MQFDNLAPAYNLNPILEIVAIDFDGCLISG